jgi:flavin-dependent dehydrogenase
MGSGQANVGVGLFLTDGVTGENLRELFDRFLRRCPHVAGAMRDAKPMGPPKGAPLRCGFTGAKRVSAGLLLAGETLGTTYALSGEGIGKAMESGRMAARVAADALARGKFDETTLSEYERCLERAELPAKFASYDAAQRWVKHARVVNFVTARAAKSARTRSLLEAMVREEVSPERVFSLGGLLRALIG